jgi:hypothetical protein
MKLNAHRATALAFGVCVAALLWKTNISTAQPSVCAFPTQMASTPEETAWRLFVAANCPAAGQMVWEGWIEQLQFYPATGAPAGAVASNVLPPKRLHGSPLAAAIAARTARPQAVRPLLAPNTECGQMRGAPPNVVSGATVCEEVRLNPDTATFLTAASYQFRPAQTAAAQKGTDIQFPAPSIEVKVDWIPASDFSPPFTCDEPPAGVHVETIDGSCYAMAGMHISSKLLKNWLWATFEPQSMLTNPLRCITFGPCKDSWGSNPAISNGGASGFTQQTAALQSLMSQANLAPEFLNYRLAGVQTDFFEADGKTPTYLGNSIIEGENVGMTMNQASCITCHSISSIKKDNTDGFSTFLNLPPQTGAQYTIPPDWIARDFVWSMGFACPDPTQTGEQPCH